MHGRTRCACFHAAGTTVPAARRSLRLNPPACICVPVRPHLHNPVRLLAHAHVHGHRPASQNEQQRLALADRTTFAKLRSPIPPSRPPEKRRRSTQLHSLVLEHQKHSYSDAMLLQYRQLAHNSDAAQRRCRSLWRRFLYLSMMHPSAPSTNSSAKPADPDSQNQTVSQDEILEISQILDALIETLDFFPLNAHRICTISSFLNAQGHALSESQQETIKKASLIASASLASFDKSTAAAAKRSFSDKQQNDRRNNRQPSLLEFEQSAYRTAAELIAELGPAARRALSSFVWNNLLSHNETIDHAFSYSLVAASAFLDTMYSHKIIPETRALAACLALVRITSRLPGSSYASTRSGYTNLDPSSSKLSYLILSHLKRANDFDPSCPKAIEAELEFLCASPLRFPFAKSLFSSMDFEAMRIHNPPLVSACHRHMIEGHIVHESSLAKAESIFSQLVNQHNIAPNRELYITMLRARCFLGIHEQVIATYQAMRAAGHAPDMTVYSIVIRAHALVGDGDAAFALLNELLSRASPIDTQKYQFSDQLGPSISIPLLFAIVRSKDPNAMQEAEDFLEEHILGQFEISTSVFNIMIYGYARRQQLSQMSAWFDRLISFGCKPDAVTYSTLNYGVLKTRESGGLTGTPESALNALAADFENKSGISAKHVRSAISDTIILNYLLKSVDMSHAMTWFENHFEFTPLQSNLSSENAGNQLVSERSIPDNATYTTILMAYVDKGNYKAAMSFFEFLRSSNFPGFRMTLGMYRALLKITLFTAGNEQQAYELYLHMLSEHIFPDVNTIIILINAFLQAYNQKAFITVINRSVLNLQISRSIYFNTRILTCLFDKLGWKPANATIIAIFTELIRHNVAANDAVIKLMLSRILSEKKTFSVLPIICAIAKEASERPYVMQILPCADIFVTLYMSVLDPKITMNHVTVSVPEINYKYHNDLASLSSTQGSHSLSETNGLSGSAVKSGNDSQTEAFDAKSVLYRVFCAFTSQYIRSSATLDPTVFETCLRAFGKQRRGDLIYDLWCIVCEAAVSSPDTQSLSTLERPEADRLPNDPEQAHPSIKAADLPVHLAAVVIEQLGIYARDEALTRSVWAYWTQFDASQASESVDPTEPDQSHEQDAPLPPSYITENHVWAFARVLIWWGRPEEAVELVTTGVIRLNLSSYDRLVRQMMDWFAWKSDMSHLRDQFITFWRKRRRDLIDDNQ